MGETWIKENSHLPSLLKEAVVNWRQDKAPRLAAALSFYTLFSVSPLLVIVLAICGRIFGREAAEGQVFDRLGAVVGGDVASVIQRLLVSASQPANGVWATTVATVTLLVGASAVFGQLQDALDVVWHVRSIRGGLRELLKQRAQAFAMVILVGLLLVALLVASSVIAAVVGDLFPRHVLSLKVLDVVLSYLMVAALFGLIYKILPRAPVAWSDAWRGAVFTSLLFSLGQRIIGFYLSHFAAASAYGPATAIFVLLLWVYYSAQVFLLGAEFTAVLPGGRRPAHREQPAEAEATSSVNVRGGGSP